MFGWFGSKKTEETPVIPPPEKIELDKISVNDVSKALNLDLTKPIGTQITNFHTFADVMANPPDIQEIGMATVLGGCTGFAAKKVTKGAAFVIGVGFMGLQGLAHADLIRVNWDKVESLLVNHVDQDGDGQFTTADINVGAAKIVKNLGTDFPSASGFTAAFWLGYRFG